jgi:hypothetical protein
MRRRRRSGDRIGSRAERLLRPLRLPRLAPEERGRFANVTPRWKRQLTAAKGARARFPRAIPLARCPEPSA